MQVQASSPTCKQTDPKAVVSGNFLRNNMAGPGKSGTWWMVDLGRQHRLICNYYLLRHDASTDYPRDWVLQVKDCHPALQFWTQSFDFQSSGRPAAFPRIDRCPL